MCRNNCVCALDCICCGVKNESRTVILELLTSLILSAAVDLGIEFGCDIMGCNFHDSSKVKAWLKEGMLSSGVSALCITLSSTIIRIANYKYGHRTEADQAHKGKPLYFSIALTLSELASGAIAFGLGVLIDYFIESTLTHNKIKHWEHSNAIPLALLAPVGITLAKTLGRVGIFKLVDWGLGKVCSSNNEELQPIAMHSIN
jgi:hypothetical protein